MEVLSGFEYIKDKRIKDSYFNFRKSVCISQAVLLVRGCCHFSTSLEVIPGHPIAFALQSLL